MTEDKDIKNSYGFLDSIIEYLASYATSYSAKIEDMHFHMFGVSFEDNKKDFVKGIFRTISNKNFFEDSNLNITDNTQSQYIKLIEALSYLRKNELIVIDNKLVVQLTFKGILKYSNSFTCQHQKNKDDSERLLFVENTQLNQNQKMTEATQDMLSVNKNISRLTFWIALASVVASIYYLLLILKLLFPKISISLCE